LPVCHKPTVAVILGSDSDLPVMEGAVEVLEELRVPFELHVISAHRSPEKARSFAQEADARGIRVLIAAAGGAAHLAGVLASHTTLPVIGVPMPTERMGGLDSLLSTVQMPSGVPVATVGLGKSGARNAALLAAQVLSLSDTQLKQALASCKVRMAQEVEQKDLKVNRWLKERGGAAP